MPEVDVALVGGGPAGLALAAALARSGARVALWEREARIPSKAGESLGPGVRPALEQLGLWGAFAALPTLPFRGVQAAWGQADLAERPALLHPLGEGWHVDRRSFDAMLEAQARTHGTQIRRGGGPVRIQREGQGFQVHGPGREPVFARFAVDASGRGAPATAGLSGERRWCAVDRQVGLLVDLPGATDRLGSELLLEACPSGWWYTVPQPAGGLRSVWLTDADLLPSGGRSSLAAAFGAALATTRHTQALLAGQVLPAPRVVRADTGFLLPAQGAGWWAVGDACMGGDPLGGNGLERAFHRVLEVLPSVRAALAGDEGPGFPDPWPALGTYLATRARYYAQESRWADAPFWRRRRQPEATPLWLAPTAPLSRGRWTAEALACSEARIPRTLLKEALAGVPEDAPAHQWLRALQARIPWGADLLLAALQGLVEDGALRTTT